jgi:transcriptional regulator with XRE-family HTH domain
MTGPKLDVRTMIAAVEAAPMRRAQIARETGLSRSHITNILNGDRGREPRHATFVRVELLHARLFSRENK